MAKGQGLLHKPNQERGEFTKQNYYISKINSEKKIYLGMLNRA